MHWGGQDLPPELPPYVLGAWLGDGHSRLASITTADPEVAEFLTDFSAKFEFKLRIEDLENNASSTYHITNHFKRSGSLLTALRKNDLLNNKHVPLAYRTASTADRLELLAGVIDSDGHYDGKGYDVIFKNETLANDVAFVARSLGFAAYPRRCEKVCTNTGAAGVYWRQYISGDIDAIPVKIPRKKAAPRKQKKDVLRVGLSVEAIGVGDYFGFEISGDRLFLLGDFTVTHNTVCFSQIMHDHEGYSAAIVHRREILGQISLSLAHLGVRHRIIAPPKTVKLIRRKHIKKLGKSYIDPHSRAGVVSVQTLTSKSGSTDPQTSRWISQVSLAVFDEGHHYVTTGLWAKAVEMVDRAKKLFVTATPERADGKGLGIDHAGFAEVMVEGPTLQWLIDNGYLSPFKYIAPPSDFNVQGLAVTASGDFNPKALRARVVESHLVGDIVEHYKKFALGTQAIVFASDVETAGEMAQEFKKQGIVAASMSGYTPPG